MNAATRSFIRRLKRQRRAHQAGLAFRECLRLAGYGVIALTVFAAADFLLAFSSDALLLIRSALLGALGVIAAFHLARIARFSPRAYAAYIDTVQRNRRQDIYGALELAQTGQTNDTHALEQYLVNENVLKAEQRLAALRLREVFPSRPIRKQTGVLAVQLLIAAVCLGAPHSVSGVVLERIFHPERDRPPYSPYRFAIAPDAPRVLYGQSVELTADITGAPVRDSVYLLTRRDGQIQRAACFQESPERYAQRLEQIIQPMEFAFALGRARSEWHSINVLLDPRIVAARTTMEPPPYSRKPTRTLIAGEEPIAELAGARLSMEVASNRPLLDGTLTIRATDGSGDAVSIPGTVAGRHRVRFDWTLRYPAELDVQIRDARGTPNQEAFVLTQDIIPDEAPRAHITEPPAYALATPDATVRLAGYAEDDLALRRVELARGLVGFRDRVDPIGPDIPRTQWPFERDLVLPDLGVVPGQTLEFYLEAQDSNPDWTGIGASDVVRIEIISDEDYADLIRARVRTEDFIARYRAAMQAVESIKQQIAAMLEHLEDEAADPGELAAAFEALKKAYDEAHGLLNQLARDFPAFDAEIALRETLRDLAATMQRHRPALDDRDPGDERLQRRLAMILDDLRAFDDSMREHMETAEHVAQVGRVFELTQHYLQLVRAQEQLVRRMERYPDPARIRDRALFESFRREESAIREALLRFREELVRRADELPEEYDELKRTSLAFAEAIETLQIPDVMRDVIRSADNQVGADMMRHSELALERMRELITQCESNAFGGLMQCELRFQVRDRARNTLQQIMMSQAGLGMGAGMSDGYSMNAHTPLNVPMFGPGRSDIVQRMLEGGHGRESGPGIGAIGERARQIMRPDRRASDGQDASPIERAPEKYRDALQRYFGLTEDTP